MTLNKTNFILLLLIYGIHLFFPFKSSAQSLFPKNFSHLYTVTKSDEDSLVGVINKKYLQQMDFFQKNDSVYTTENESEFIISHFNLNNPAFYEVNIDYLLDTSQNLNRFLKRCGVSSSKVNTVNFPFFLEENSSDKKFYFSLLIEKNKIYENRILNNIRFSLKEKLVDSTGKPYKWRKFDHILSKAFPFQNTVWYFDSKIEQENKIDKEGYEHFKTTSTLYFSKIPKYPNKIEFINDIDFIIEYREGERVKTLKGNYSTYTNEISNQTNQLIDIDFEAELVKEIKPKRKVVNKKGIPIEEEVQKYIHKDIIDLKKGTTDFFIKLFNFNYEIKYNFEDNDIKLFHIDQYGGIQPTLPTQPFTPQKIKNK